jgi:HIT domain
MKSQVGPRWLGRSEPRDLCSASGQSQRTSSPWSCVEPDLPFLRPTIRPHHPCQRVGTRSPRWPSGVPGHTLIIPRRHVGSFFEITDAERADLISLLAAARGDLDRQFHPAGYNVGMNDGAATGQTVPHLHIHLIPRYEGDREDPRGGVRWVLADKAAYWNRG